MKEWFSQLPAPFQIPFLGLPMWQWLGAGTVLAVGLLVAVLGRYVAVRVMDSREKRLGERLSAETERALRRAVALLAGVAVARPLLATLELPRRLEQPLEALLEGGLIAGSVLMAVAIWDGIVDNVATRAAGHHRAERLLVPMTRKFVRALIVLVGMMIALRTLFHVDVSAVAAGLGLTTLVVALAAKDSVENVFGSLTILFDMPFAMGDWVRIGPTEGIVEEINLRSTRIRTFEDTVITLPNANLIRATVENVSSRRARRQVISLRISYDTAPEALDAFTNDLRDWLNAQPNVVPEKTIVRVSDLAEPSLGVLVQCQFSVGSQAEELEERHALALQVLRLRDRHGVLFAAHPRPLPPVPPDPL